MSNSKLSTLRKVTVPSAGLCKLFFRNLPIVVRFQHSGNQELNWNLRQKENNTNNRTQPPDRFYDRRLNPLYTSPPPTTKFSQHSAQDYHLLNNDIFLKHHSSSSENVQRTFGNNNNNNSSFRNNLQQTPRRMDAETYFNIAKLLAIGKFNDENVPLDILPSLPIISMRFNDETNFSRKCLLNWWLALRDNVTNVEKTALARTILGLEKLNLKTNGYVLEVISWDIIQRLACVCMSGVDKVSSKSFRLLLSALTDFCTVHKRIPSEYLKRSLSDGMQTFFLSKPYQRYIKSLNRDIGNICENIVLLNITIPSTECLKTIVQSCWVVVNYNYDQPQLLMTECFLLLININYIADAFLKWQVDGDEYHKGFWLSLFTAVECLVKNKIRITNNDGRCLVVETFKNCLLAALKFDKVQQFRTIERFWLEQLEDILSVLEVSPLTECMQEDFKTIETTLENEHFEAFRPILVKCSEILNKNN